MSKPKRHRPQFDLLEEKVLLSTVAISPTASKHHKSIKPFALTGSFSGLPNGSTGVAGYTESSFPVSGHVASMGAVDGSLNLADPFIPIGKLPNLAGSSVVLESSKGAIDLAVTKSKNHKYKFKVISGTAKYALATGSGTMTISSIQSNLNLVFKLQSTHSDKP